MDIEREFKSLTNKLNKYKKKRLGFECGVAVGYVTEINLVKDTDSKYPWNKAIEVKGIAGWESDERVLMLITEKMKKGKDYKYWNKYHVLERFYD